jgi:hypothetical protein
MMATEAVSRTLETHFILLQRLAQGCIIILLLRFEANCKSVQLVANQEKVHPVMGRPSHNPGLADTAVPQY